MTIEADGVFEHWHAVDESEEADFECIIVSRPLPGLLHPPLRRDRRRLTGKRSVQQAPADALHIGLDAFTIHRQQLRGEQGG